MNPWDLWEQTSPWYSWTQTTGPRMMEWDRYHKQWISNLMRSGVAPPVYSVHQERYSGYQEGYQDKDAKEEYQSDLSEDRNHQ